MKAFWLSLALTFWAEMGDKTQFIALAYATRYRLRDVLLGILLAVAAILLSYRLPSGASIGCHGCRVGMSMRYPPPPFSRLRCGPSLGDEESNPIREGIVDIRIMIVAVTFFLAEFGDKTMFSTAALATTHAWLPVWAGATAGMVLSDGLSPYGLARTLGRQIPERESVHVGCRRGSFSRLRHGTESTPGRPFVDPKSRGLILCVASP